MSAPSNTPRTDCFTYTLAREDGLRAEMIPCPRSEWVKADFARSLEQEAARNADSCSIQAEHYRSLNTAYCQLADAHAALLSQVARLREGLKPFAKFACDEPHVGEPMCHNCVARALLAETEGGES